MTSEIILGQPSAEAGPDDLDTASDLRETFEAHRAHCVGMAANMIGIRKRIIVFDDKGATRIMLNPEITEKHGPYQAEEGRLSLTGKRTATRYQRIAVQYLDPDSNLEPRTERFTGFTAQIIQHEVDHCNGIVI